MLEKLGLSTVQFGQAYGVSNRGGRIGPYAIVVVAAATL